MRRKWAALRWIGAALLGTWLSGVTLAQVDLGDHAAHHPGPPPAAGPDGGVMSSTPAPTPQPSDGCGRMMGCMGGEPRPFYTSLLDMPALTPDARRAIQAEADRRIGWGSQAIATGHARLEAAFAADDAAAVGVAVGVVREGLLNVESGTAMLRATANGTPPRTIALTWFRDQLSLPAPEAAPIVMEGGTGLWGLSWYHLTTMVLLVAFVAGTLLIQYARMRRVGGLVQRLATAGATPTPAAEGAPSPDPAAPPSTAAAPLPASGPSAAPVPAAGPAPSPAAATAAAKRPWSGRLRLAAVFPETPNIKTFRLVNPKGGEIPFAFMPGQFLTISAGIDGTAVRRSYTIASSPTQRSYVEVTVKREDQGVISRHLHDRVAVGDLLDISAPLGVFTFTGAEADSIVLIAGGVGITPMMSVVRYLTDTSYPGEIHFLYGARTTADFIFREELEYLQKRHPRLHVAATMSRSQGTAWMGVEGPITKEFIARAVPEIARRRVHLCGPSSMMEAVKVALAELGVPKEQVKTEAFGPARGVTPGPAAPLPAPAPAAPPAPALASTPAATVLRVATAEVLFTKSGKSGALAPDQTVLEAAEAIEVPIDYSCRVGICGACKVPLLKGEVTMEVEEGLPPEDKARGLILACQAKSVGSLEVEA